MRVAASVPNSLRGEELMRLLKTQAYPIENPYAIIIKDSSFMRLRLVSTIDPDKGDLKRLSVWRNRYVKSFLTEFDATPSRTKNWLMQNVGKDISRILFMIEEMNNPPVGYIGLAFINFKEKRGELDSVVRGEHSHPGIMSESMKTLIDWSRYYLDIQEFGVRVLNDNPAVEFYKKFGFVEHNKTILKRKESPGLVEWVASNGYSSEQASDRWLVHMELK